MTHKWWDKSAREFDFHKRNAPELGPWTGLSSFEITSARSKKKHRSFIIIYDQFSSPITNSNAYQPVKPPKNLPAWWITISEKYFLVWWLPSLIKLEMGINETDRFLYLLSALSALLRFGFSFGHFGLVKSGESDDLCCQWWLLRNALNNENILFI